MATIEIIARQYSGAYASVNGTTQESISLLSLLRCMVTVGYRKETDVIGYGWRSIGWHLSTCFLTAAVTAQQNGNLAVSRLFRSLDSSEKNTVSFRLGMGLTKFAAEAKLGVGWLIHAERLLNAGGLTLQTGTLERGDLVGRDHTGTWHVFEAKGRSNPPSSKLLTKAKNQATRIQSINGQPPATKSASIVHLHRAPIRVELIDPDDEATKVATMTIGEHEFFSAYYALLLQLMESADIAPLTLGNVKFTVARFHLGPGFTVGIGLADLIRRVPAEAVHLPEMMRGIEAGHRENPKLSVGLDGVLTTIL